MMSDLNLIKVFNYTVIALANRYVRNNLVVEREELTLCDILSRFNSSNDFSKDKLVLLPFLITIGNGKKQELLNFFTKDNDTFFYPSYQGILHNKITDKIYTNNNDELLFKSDMVSSKIEIENFKNYITIESYRDSLDLDIKNILSYIDRSIDFLHEFRIKNFANRPFEQLSHLSKNNFAYKMYYSKNINELTKEQIRDKYKDALTSIISKEDYELSPTF